MHREQQYRLDPTLVTKNLKIYHEKQFGPETDVDTGTVPVPDLYDSWKVSYAKQPRLLSARRTRFGVLTQCSSAGVVAAVVFEELDRELEVEAVVLASFVMR